jgi:hypothetical protein
MINDHIYAGMVGDDCEGDDTVPDGYHVVTCLTGHIMLFPKDSEIGERAQNRIDNGYLDALCLGPGECPECNREAERELQKYIEYGINPLED